MRVTHKNKIFEALRSSEFGIDNFSFSENDSAGTVTFKNSPLKFTIEPFPGDYNGYKFSYTNYSPKFLSQSSRPQVYSIDDVLFRLKEWLTTDLKDYTEDNNAVDLWVEYKKGAEYLDVTDLNISDNTYFSKDDKLRIQFLIDDLRRLIPQRIEVSSDQIGMINAKLDYLVDASSRVSKTDWKGITIGIIASIIIALSLDTEKGHQLWKLLIEIFRTIYLLPEKSI